MVTNMTSEISFYYTILGEHASVKLFDYLELFVTFYWEFRTLPDLRTFC